MKHYDKSFLHHWHHPRTLFLQKVSDGLNIMGWKTGHLDFLDPDDVFNPASQVLVQYDYYADGKLAWAKTTSNGNSSNDDTKMTMQYDALGNRTRLADPDYGTVDSHYDAFGRLCWTASPKGDTTAYEYDGLGRLIVRSETDHVDNTSVITRWYYSDDEGRKGLLDSIWYDGGQQVVHYSYDTLNRVIQVTETRGNQNYSTSYEYDEFSRVTAIEYPSHYVTRNAYSHGTGHLVTIMNNDGKMIWELNELNAMGQIVEFQTGDGTISKRDYDDMYRLETQLAKNGNNIIQDFTYVYDDFSNLAARTENKYAIPMTESFTYDRFNRLDSIKFNSLASVMTYDPHGRILSKQADGHTVFDNAQYATYDQNNLLKPHAISSASVTDGFLQSPRLEATYTTFDKVKRLAKYDDNDNVDQTLSFTYGYDYQRVRMVDSVGNSLYRKKTYVGNCEYNHDPDCERTLTYLSAPSGVFAVHLQEGGYYLDNVTQVSQRLLYLHKDHLGSITTITDASGTIQQELSFDAWGNLRNPTTWSGSFTGTPLIDRGFTGHEHLYGFGLINMNGRMYDPVMSSFLSVDSYVQDPENSQNFNRYAYCFNNPLRYTDPSGEVAVVDDILIAAAIGAAISVTMNGISNSMNNVGFFQGAGKAAIVGGLAGATGAGVAALGAGAGMVGMAAGVVSGGTSAALNNGNIVQGIVIGGLSGWIGGGVSQYIGGGWGALAGGALSNAAAQVPGIIRGEKFDYKQLLISSGLSWGMYMGTSYFNWQCRGGKKMGDLDVSFKQFCKMQTLFQRSRAWELEMGGYLMKDGSFKKVPNGTSSEITFEATPPEGALAEFHTHWDKPGSVRMLNESGSDYIDFNNYEEGTILNHVAAQKVSRYHGITDFTEGIQSIVLNRYDGSYFSGNYMLESLPNGFIGPPNWAPTPYQIITPPVLRYNYSFLFSIRY